MYRLCSNALIQLVLVLRSSALDVEVTGEVSFALQRARVAQRAREGEGRPRVDGVTAAPIVECLYQYPDEEQFNAMLSNMMNELTKVFVRLHELMVPEDLRRHGTRFAIVDKRDENFFEDVYANMTKEYRSFYNSTTERVSRTREEPCQNQEELQAVWRSLLERSLASLRKAALRCIEEFLETQGKSGDERARYKLTQYLLRELARARASQLHTLCDNFQLCYNDLL